jgi:hypothetical protein
VRCFCQTTAGDYATLSKAFPTPGSPLGETQTLCLDWLGMQAKVTGLMAASVVGVLIVNLLLADLMERLVSFERQKSATGELTAISKRVFLSQLLNTAIVTLVVNGNLSLFFPDDRQPFGVFSPSGPFSDTTVDWFTKVGTSIALTMFLNVFTPHLKFAVVPALRRSLAICLDRDCTYNRHRSKHVVQADYEMMFWGPTFRIGARYGQMLNIIFVTMMFSRSVARQHLRTDGFAFVAAVAQYPLATFDTYRHQTTTSTDIADTRTHVRNLPSLAPPPPPPQRHPHP